VSTVALGASTLEPSASRTGPAQRVREEIDSMLSSLRRRAGLLAVAATALFVASGCGQITTLVAGGAPATAQRDLRSQPVEQTGPLVIGHRGASGYRPEHTLASYELAVRLGADYIEPDLVATKDGHLVARHENEISATTDVTDHPEFADRKTTKTVDGEEITGWFTEDFTLAELKTLRAVERIPDIRQHNTLYDGRYEVPTLQEVIDLAGELSRETGQRIGIYPETKHPTYFQSVGLPLEPPLVRTLTRSGLNRPGAAVFVQSFETANLREISSYADGIGPDKNRIVPRDDAGFLQEPTGLVDDAHDAGLLVHPYTFRNENAFLPADLRSSPNPSDYGDALAEYELFYSLGVDGLFSDNPDTAVAARAGVPGRAPVGANR
jgi:glycerophosphoryl diester phosphodiesterase